MNTDSHILLINPPFSTFSHPYISIPTLASYLRPLDIRVKGYDMNREFYVRLLNPSNIKRGIESSLARLQALNGKKALSFLEMFEYRILAALLNTIAQCKKDCTSLYSLNFERIQKIPIQKLLITLATMPYYPSVIVTEPLFSIVRSANCFSTADILHSLDEDSYYTQTYQTILDTALRGDRPCCIGFSVVFQDQIIPAFQCAYRVKQMAPDIHITLGGPCISIFFREVAEKALFGVVDSLVMDEGEIPLRELYKALNTGASSFRNVPGLVYLEGDKIVSNPPPPPLDIRESPPPDYRVFLLDKYLAPRERLVVPFRTTKGCCWAKCAFCRTHLTMTREYQTLSGEQAYGQLRSIIEETGIRSFIFSDESAPLDILEHLSRQLLEDDIKINWRAHTRVSRALTRERAELYKAAGCRYLMLGVESLSDRILALMKKGIPSRLSEEVLRNVNGVLPIGAYLIVGFPTETEEEAVAGFEQMKSWQEKGLVQLIYYSQFSIHRGSDIWEHPSAYSIDRIDRADEDLPGDTMTFTGAGMSRERCCYYFRKFNDVDMLARRFYHVKRIELNGRVIPLNFDMETMSRIIDWGDGGLVERNLFDWIHKRNRTEAPMPCMRT